MNKIEPGCWLDTRWGPAVCTSISEEREGVMPDGPIGQPPVMHRFSCTFRYEAHRCVHGDEGRVVDYEEKSIWVANGDFIAEVDDDPEWMARYRGPADKVSRHVLTLKGPYGEG